MLAVRRSGESLWLCRCPKGGEPQPASRWIESTSVLSLFWTESSHNAQTSSKSGKSGVVYSALLMDFRIHLLIFMVFLWIFWWIFCQMAGTPFSKIVERLFQISIGLIDRQNSKGTIRFKIWQISLCALAKTVEDSKAISTWSDYWQL